MYKVIKEYEQEKLVEVKSYKFKKVSNSKYPWSIIIQDDGLKDKSKP